MIQEKIIKKLSELIEDLTFMKTTLDLDKGDLEGIYNKFLDLDSDIEKFKEKTNEFQQLIRAGIKLFKSD